MSTHPNVAPGWEAGIPTMRVGEVKALVVTVLDETLVFSVACTLGGNYVRFVRLHQAKHGRLKELPGLEVHPQTLSSCRKLLLTTVPLLRTGINTGWHAQVTQALYSGSQADHCSRTSLWRGRRRELWKRPCRPWLELHVRPLSCRQRYHQMRLSSLT